VGNRTYRFSISGRFSDPFTIHFVPATFTIAGSGFGHGVGLSQWGAYEMARVGNSAADILSYYYPGAAVSTAVNNKRTVKVQVLGPPVDSRTTTTLKVANGGFTVSGDGIALKSYSTPGTVAIGVNGSKVTAAVTLANGKVRKQELKSSSRITLTWKTGPVTVAGAQGSYTAGNLQVTVIGKRPNVVNQVAMNTDYLYGIDEMPSSWGSASGGGRAALQAQAIAARNYVITAIYRLPTAQQDQDAGAPACDCHVYDDTRSQNFVGAKKSSGSANKPWIDAVDATIVSDAEVQVVRAAGLIAETPYFASSGSYTADDIAYSGTAGNADVFGSNPLSYLSHVDDPYSAEAPGNTHLSWSRSLSQAGAQSILGLSEPVASLTVTSRYPGGLVHTISAVTASGQKVDVTKATSEAWRTSLGLPGAWIRAIAGK
jgi:stage II sporulation protein D